MSCCVHPFPSYRWCGEPGVDEKKSIGGGEGEEEVGEVGERRPPRSPHVSMENVARRSGEAVVLGDDGGEKGAKPAGPSAIQASTAAVSMLRRLSWPVSSLMSWREAGGRMQRRWCHRR